MTTPELRLQIFASHLSPAFGLQTRRGDLHMGELLPDETLRFLCPITVKAQANGHDFAGDYVHGTQGERFLYLGRRDEHSDAWIRRIKVMLSDIPPDLIEAALREARPLTATVDCTTGARARLLRRWALA